MQNAPDRTPNGNNMLVFIQNLGILDRCVFAYSQIMESGLQLPVIKKNLVKNILNILKNPLKKNKTKQKHKQKQNKTKQINKNQKHTLLPILLHVQ